MKKRKLYRAAALIVALAICMSLTLPAGAAYENTHENTGNQAEDAVAVALTQLGYPEGSYSFSKYGQWYGIPHSHWCATFVSWCLSQAKVPSSTVKRFASCTTAMNNFKRMGIWHDGPYYGGSYAPETGDLIFYDWYGTGDMSHHVGLVLYKENGWVYTVEGNVVVNRLDREEKFLVQRPSGSGGSSFTEEITGDEVIVRCIKADSIYIRGYASPNYAGDAVQTDLFTGMVDVAPGSRQEREIERVIDMGLMQPKSSHVFGAKYGVTRGEYVELMARVFGLNFYAPETAEFSDVSKDHANYSAVMALRHAGIISGTEENVFNPDIYISVDAARAVLERLCNYISADCPAVGYTGNVKDGYLQRYELAHALCVLLDNGVDPVPAEAQVILDGKEKTVSAYNANGTNYVSATDWYELISGSVSKLKLKDFSDTTLRNAPEKWMQNVSFTVTQAAEGETPEIFKAEAFLFGGERYYKLRDIAAATGITVGWDAEAGKIMLSGVPVPEIDVKAFPADEEIQPITEDVELESLDAELLKPAA